jgi:hypothetical protein
VSGQHENGGPVLFGIDRFGRIYFQTGADGAQIVVDGRFIWYPPDQVHAVVVEEFVGAIQPDKSTTEERLERLERDWSEEQARRWFK